MDKQPDVPSTYNVDMVCLNCGTKATVPFPKGREVPRRKDCPNCGCFTMTRTFATVSHSVSTESGAWSSDLAQCMDVFFNGRSAK